MILFQIFLTYRLMPQTHDCQSLSQCHSVSVMLTSTDQGKINGLLQTNWQKQTVYLLAIKQTQTLLSVPCCEMTVCPLGTRTHKQILADFLFRNWRRVAPLYAAEDTKNLLFQAREQQVHDSTIISDVFARFYFRGSPTFRWDSSKHVHKGSVTLFSITVLCSFYVQRVPQGL